MAELPVTDKRQRLDVADALMELVGTGELSPDLADEVIPRLLPREYADIQGWYQSGMSAREAESLDGVLAELENNDRIKPDQAAQARLYLNIGRVAA